MDIPSAGGFEAFALLVDINGFGEMVEHPDWTLIAQFTRDVLTGGIDVVQDVGGEVVAFMGDAFLAVLPNVDAVVQACFRIAKEVDDQCEFLSNAQAEDAEVAPYAPGGPSLKLTFEYGRFDCSEIESRFAGMHRLLVSRAINYASRIASAGEGNRCLCGPVAARMVQERYAGLSGPFQHSVKGKEFQYFDLELGDEWKVGPRIPGDETYMG